MCWELEGWVKSRQHRAGGLIVSSSFCEEQQIQIQQCDSIEYQEIRIFVHVVRLPVSMEIFGIESIVLICLTLPSQEGIHLHCEHLRKFWRRSQSMHLGILWSCSRDCINIELNFVEWCLGLECLDRAWFRDPNLERSELIAEPSREQWHFLSKNERLSHPRIQGSIGSRDSDCHIWKFDWCFSSEFSISPKKARDNDRKTDLNLWWRSMEQWGS